MKSLAPNTLLQNRYLIVHLIGRGGMGEVYLAVDQRLGSAVAVKRTKFSDDEMLGNAFEREAKILARLRHSVLPKVSDHFVEQENQFLIMEHISGDDLAKRLEINQKPFPLSWVLFWADQLLDALSYLHSHEPPIIHRDIKPQNLKLTDDNNIILLDFGLSKNSVGFTNISQSAAGGSNASGSVVGYTPHYAPMEQIRGTGTNPRSDIYSLSATLYQLLTNIVPSDALSRADAVLSGMEDPLRPISETNPEVTKALSDVILKGMSVSQDRRFSVAREMQRELREAYSQMQSAMSAKTIVFGATTPQSEEQFPMDSQPLQQKLDKIATPPIDTEPLMQAGIKTQVIPTALDSSVSPENGNSYNPQPQNQEQDFDKTVQYDTPLANFIPKQADVKTEVFSGSLESEPKQSEKENFPANDQFKTNEQLKAERNFSRDATVPLISYDSYAAAAGENNSAGKETDYSPAFPPEEEKARSAAPVNQPVNHQAAKTFVPAPVGDYSNKAEDNSSQPVDYSKPAEANYYSQPQSPQPIQPQQPAASSVAAAVAPPAQKKSTGKIIAIVGGLAALLILGISAAGVGWYLLKDSGEPSVTNTTTAPTTEPTAASTATPEETLVETNTDANNASNQNSTDTNTNGGTTNQDVIQTGTPTPDKTNPVQTPAQATPAKPTPAQTQVVPTRTPVKNVTPPQTPRPTPKKPPGTPVILQ